MKMKYNFGLLKNMPIGFVNKDGIKFHDVLQNVKTIGNKYRFIFPNNYIEVNDDVFKNFIVRFHDDVYWFEYESPKTISGFFMFCMYDTFGFPMEMTKEELEEKGFSCDEEGFYVVKEIQKIKTKNTFNNKDAFVE